MKTGIYIKCKTCNKEFYIHKSRIGKKKYCSKKCQYPKIYKNCLTCGKKFRVTKTQFNRLKNCSKKCSNKYRSGKYILENSPSWKGDKAGYFAIHQWLYTLLGGAKKYKCKCGKQAKHWANKDHKYKRIKEDI